MEHNKRIYNFKLDFLYQSITVYAATLVMYLLIRGWFVEKEFAIMWRDPILYLLSAITLVSILALLYYMFMKRRIEVDANAIHFISAVRKRSILRSEVASVRFARERKTATGGGARVISLRLRDRRRPIRIRPVNFEQGKRLAEDLRTWAGDLATESTSPLGSLSGTRGARA